MSPALSLDPPAVHGLARVLDAAATAADAVAGTVVTASVQAGLDVPSAHRLGPVHEQLTLAAEVLHLRADLADGFRLGVGVDGPELTRALATVRATLAERQGPTPDAAAALRTLLATTTVPSPDGLFEPDSLAAVVAAEPALAAAVGAAAAHADDPAWLGAFFAALGPEALAALVLLVNAVGYAADSARLDDDVYGAVLVPLARALGAAQRSGVLAPEVEAAVLDLGPADPAHPAFDRLAPDEFDEARAVAEERRRVLALLLHEGGFAPAFTADAASRIARTGPVLGFFTHEGFRVDHPDLALTDLVALHALTASDDAMRAFVLAADPARDTANAAYLVQLGSFNTFALDRAGSDTAVASLVLRDDLVTTATTVLERGLLVGALRDGATRDGTQLAAVTAALRAAAVGGVDDRLKRTVATLTAPYVRDVAAAYDAGGAAALGGPSGLAGLTRAEVVAAFQELSHDDRAREILAANGPAAMVATMRVDAGRYAAGDHDALEAEGRTTGVWFAALGDGMHAADIARAKARAAVLKGFRMVTDPLVAVATGELPGGKVPVVGDYLKAGTGALSGALYDLFVPTPPTTDLASWHDSVNQAVNRSLVELAWSDPGLRLALGGPTDADLADLTRADPMVAAAVRRHWEQGPAVVDFLARNAGAVNGPLAENRSFVWLTG